MPIKRAALRQLRKDKKRTVRNQAIRSEDQYKDQSARNREELSLSLYGRGMGNSSIATEDKAFFE